MERPVAKVAVDLPLANLDRPFDYAVPPELDADAQPGVRVKVRFAGQLRDGFVLDRTEPGERTDLTPLHRVVSPEPVLTAEVAALVRAVADHYAGSFADVVRAAVPPRHAATERAPLPDYPPPSPGEQPAGVLTSYPDSSRFLDTLTSGGRPRAAWTVLPTTATAGDWAAGFAEAAAATVASGRGALLLVPDARQLKRLSEAVTARFGRGSHAVLAADAGPAARYRNFLAVSRGQVRLVLGTRAAVFAPVRDLGLIALWDDGNDAWAEPHAPYWHAREVAAMRAHLSGCGLLLAAHARTAEVQQLVARAWLAELQFEPGEARRRAAAIRTAAATRRDPQEATARLPHDAFTVVRAGLAAGPVLVQVPRAGYLPVLVCANCRSAARCPSCGQALSDRAGTGPSCRWCGPVVKRWRCSECGDSRLRSPVVGVARTAEEFGKAFPGTTVLQASADKPLAVVGAQPALVLATPGAAPPATGGYAAAVLLDAELMLGRPELRAGEEALRRWLAVAALVRPATEGGTVMVVADAGLREVQALLRLDPVGYAERELADRAAAGFPPVLKLVTLEGAPGTVAAATSDLDLPHGTQLLGPFDLPADGADPIARVTLRCPLPMAGELVARLRTMQSVRAAKKEPPIRVRVDPQVLG